MTSLTSIAMQNRSEFITEDGATILGTIFPVEEGKIPSYDFTPARQMFRVGPDSVASPGMVITDAFGAKHLLAEMGSTTHFGSRVYRTFRLYQMTGQMVWTRESSQTDTITGLAKASGRTSLGSIWVANEIYGREEVDRALRIREEISRIITGANIQLNDLLDGRVVRRVNTLLGVKIAEIL